MNTQGVSRDIITRMASSGEELVNRKTSASSNLSDLDRRGSSPSIYDLDEGSYNTAHVIRRVWLAMTCSSINQPTVVRPGLITALCM